MLQHWNRMICCHHVKALPRHYRAGVSSMGRVSHHQPVNAACFQYGDSSWESIVSSNKYYVDKTEAISRMEETGIHLKLWRPRRFGKTLFCNQLAKYYDVLTSAKDEDFQRLFGNTFIGRNPTMNRGKYMVFSLSFNEVSDDNVNFGQRFNDYINSAIVGFSKRYHDAGYLEDPIDINPSNAMSSFDWLLFCVSQSKHKLYLIVDEYDSFANRLLLNIDTSVDDIDSKQYRHLIASKDSILRSFGNMVKSGSSDAIARTFFTGVTPVALCDAISGLNMVKDISSDPDLASTFGLSEDNLKTALSKLALSEEEQSKHLMKLRCHFNGYRFHRRQQDGVYNPQACFHYLQSLVETGEAPNPIFDTNIGVSSDNVIDFLVRHKHAEMVLADLIFSPQPAAVRFDIQSVELFDKSLSSETILSLAYHHGYLTYSNDVESHLVCPNLELKRILMESLSKGNHNARRMMNEVLKAHEMSDEKTRNELFSVFTQLIVSTSSHIGEKLL